MILNCGGEDAGQGSIRWNTQCDFQSAASVVLGTESADPVVTQSAPPLLARKAPLCPLKGQIVDSVLIMINQP